MVSSLDEQLFSVTMHPLTEVILTGSDLNCQTHNNVQPFKLMIMVGTDNAYEQQSLLRDAIVN